MRGREARKTLGTGKKRGGEEGKNMEDGFREKTATWKLTGRRKNRI